MLEDMPPVSARRGPARLRRGPVQKTRDRNPAALPGRLLEIVRDVDPAQPKEAWLTAGLSTVLQDVLDACPTEVAVLDPNGTVLVASKAWQEARDARMSSEQAKSGKIGNPLALSSRKSEIARIENAIEKVLSGASPMVELDYASGEGRRRRSFHLRVTALAQDGRSGAMIFNEDVSELRSLHRDKKVLVEELLRSEEKERRRIAREMHDSTVQDLVAIGLMLKRLAAFSDDPMALKLHVQIRTILTRTQQDVRTMSYLLHPPLLDEGGLTLALSSLIHGLSARMNMGIAFECEDGASRLPIDTEIALYRIAQEALINVHRHAAATHAVVRYGRSEKQVYLEVDDDGVGLGGAKGYRVGSGVGIEGMRARLAQLGGALTLSRLRQGTRLCATIPYSGESL